MQNLKYISLQIKHIKKIIIVRIPSILEKEDNILSASSLISLNLFALQTNETMLCNLIN
jgi:hypothetical protein